MSDFPELQGYEVPSGGADEISEKDLLSRERELLGEDAAEFVGSSAGTVASEPVSDAEPDLQHSDILPGDSLQSNSVGDTSTSKAPGAGPSAYVPQKVNLNESEFLKDWKTKRDLEIESRDKASAEKGEAARDKARRAIDDFYENYNSKKEAEKASISKDAEEFAKKRDAEIGSGKGTAWDRIADLMDGLGRPAEGVAPKNKKRFAELVNSLKGDTNTPGAAGY